MELQSLGAFRCSVPIIPRGILGRYLARKEDGTLGIPAPDVWTQATALREVPAYVMFGSVRYERHDAHHVMRFLDCAASLKDMRFAEQAGQKWTKAVFPQTHQALLQEAQACPSQKILLNACSRLLYTRCLLERSKWHHQCLTGSYSSRAMA